MNAAQRVAWVTGAGRGIGEVTARELAAAGYKVAVSARTAKDVERVAESICAAGGTAVAVPCDVTLPASVGAAADRIAGALGAVSVLVNNAGAAESHKFVGHDDELWRRMLDANMLHRRVVDEQVTSSPARRNSPGERCAKIFVYDVAGKTMKASVLCRKRIEFGCIARNANNLGSFRAKQLNGFISHSAAGAGQNNSAARQFWHGGPCGSVPKKIRGLCDQARLIS